jgi:hypothetical protein
MDPRFILALLLAISSIACAPPPPRTALAATALSVRSTSEFELTEAALEKYARSADMQVADLAEIGIRPKSYDKEGVTQLISSLEVERERDLIDVTQSLALILGELPREDEESRERRQSISKAIQDRFLPEIERYLPKRTFDEFARDVSAFIDAKSETDGIEALRQVELRLGQIPATLQRWSDAKRSARRWLTGQVQAYSFNPSITITLDVANGESRPLIVSEIAYAALPGIEARPFVQRNRQCSPDLTSCRLVYAYALTDPDMDQLKSIAPDTPLDSQVFTEKLRAFLDESVVELALFADGGTKTLTMPGKFIKLE